MCIRDRFTAAVLDTEQGEVLVRVPATPAAEVKQSAELLSLAALAEGACARLPFQVPATLGMTRAGALPPSSVAFFPGRPRRPPPPK